jgi:hypothetical protein
MFKNAKKLINPHIEKLSISLLKPNIKKREKNHKHNLHKISIQLHALIKYTMLITYFWEI